MDYSKIKLANERNSHVTKRLNRLSTWKFFTVLYRENIWRLFGYSLLMILCIAPIVVMLVLGSFNKAQLILGLPMLNDVGFSTGAWEGMSNYITEKSHSLDVFYGLMASVCGILVALMLSGGFAVIRDAFWTGKLSTVGVFRSIGKGIKANIVYALVTAVIISFSIFGLFAFYTWAATVMPLWVAIVLLVLLCIVDLLLVIYLMIVCSVSVTYKQSVADTLDDSWRLMWLNFLPNLLHILIALLPIGLYFVFSTGMFQSLYLVLVVMFGGMYFPLVWHSHMMRTFALFHPVEAKKKSQLRREQQAADRQNAAKQAEEERLLLDSTAGGKKGKKGKTAAENVTIEAPVADSDDDDPYAIEEEEITDVADGQIQNTEEVEQPQTTADTDRSDE